MLDRGSISLGDLARWIMSLTLLGLAVDTSLFVRQFGGGVWDERGGGAIGQMVRAYEISPLVYAGMCALFGLILVVRRWSPPFTFLWTIPFLFYIVHAIPALLAADTIANAPSVIYTGAYLLYLVVILFGREISLFPEDDA